MKNMKKLVALFAATVMTMSFGVSAFAAEVNTTVRNDGADIADNTFNLVFEAPTGGEADIDQLTMIAYLVPDTTTLETWVPYSNQTIVAINQVDGDEGFGSVPVDVAKLTSGNAIAVAIGGTDVAAADIKKALIKYTVAPQIVAYTVVYELGNNGTATGNPAESNSDESIADFFAKVTPPTQEGFTFKHWSKTADGAAINTGSEDKMSTLLDDADGTTVTLYAVYDVAAVPTIQVMVGDIDGLGSINAYDGTYLFEYASIPVHPKNDPKRAAVKAKYPTYKFAEVYEMADGSGKKVVVGDINLSGTIDAYDGTYLFEYASIPVHPKNDPKRAAVKAKYPTYYFAEYRTVKQK